MKKQIKHIIKNILLEQQENSYDFLTPEEEKEIRTYYEKKVWEDLEGSKKTIKDIEDEISKLEKERDDTLSKITNDPTGEIKKAVEDSYGNLIKIRNNKLERERKYIDNFDAQKEVEAWIKWDKGGVSGLSHKFRYGRWKEKELQRELNRQDIIDLFVTALEGGSNYWYKMDVPQKARVASGEFLSEKIGNFILGGGKVYFYDAENPKELLGFVNMDKVLDAISSVKKGYPHIWERILLGNADASDSDVFLQLCVMGEVVFG